MSAPAETIVRLGKRELAGRRCLLGVNDLLLDPTLQTRATVLDEETVAQYHADLLAGAEFPPVLVVKTDAGYHLVGGWQRREAHHRAGRPVILSVVVEGDRRLAEDLAIADNRNHGRPLSNQEKVSLAEMLVQRDPGNSDGTIADQIGCSRPTVSKVRARLVKEGKVETVSTVTGRDGRAVVRIAVDPEVAAAKKVSRELGHRREKVIAQLRILAQRKIARIGEAQVEDLPDLVTSYSSHDLDALELEIAALLNAPKSEAPTVLATAGPQVPSPPLAARLEPALAAAPHAPLPPEPLPAVRDEDLILNGQGEIYLPLTADVPTIAAAIVKVQAKAKTHLAEPKRMAAYVRSQLDIAGRVAELLGCKILDLDPSFAVVAGTPNYSSTHTVVRVGIGGIHIGRSSSSLYSQGTTLSLRIKPDRLLLTGLEL